MAEQLNSSAAQVIGYFKILKLANENNQSSYHTAKLFRPSIYRVRKDGPMNWWQLVVVVAMEKVMLWKDAASKWKESSGGRGERNK